MSELFLIAHKVRGLPAFDIATHLTCPVCEATNDHCHACDGVGHWWIVPTSGHRAYPYWSDPLQWYMDELCDIPSLPEGLRDHYTTEAETARSLIDTLGLAKPVARSPILRRL